MKINIEQKYFYYYLFQFYQVLLTKKQKSYFEMYIEQDLSFEEIAENKNVSRNAVFDSIKKTRNLLDHYEAKLHLYYKDQARKKIYQEYENEIIVQKLKQIE